MPTHVSGEGRADKRRTLIRLPRFGQNPSHSCKVGVYVVDGGAAEPSPQLDLAHIHTKGSREGVSRLYGFDFAGDQGQSPWVEIVGRGVCALAEFSHAADGGHRAGSVVPTFGTPGGNCAVLHGGTQREVGLDIPFQIAQDVALALELLDQIGMVADVVQDGEPVARRGFRVGTVRPKLGQHPREVAPRNHVGRIGLSRGGVDTVPRTWRAPVVRVVKRRIRFEGGGVGVAVSAGGRADVPHHAIGGVQKTRPQSHHRVAVGVDVGCAAAVHRVQGGCARIVVHFVLKAVPGVGRQVFV